MDFRKHIGRHAFALLSMGAGVCLLFGLLIAMNSQEGPARNEASRKQLQVVVKQPKKPPETRKRPAPRRAVRSTVRSSAPKPTLAAGLTGNAFGIPELAGAASLDSMAAASLNTDRAVRDMVMTESAVDKPPQPVSRVAPAYPPRARARGVTGKVVLGLLIDASGRVLKVKVLEADPSGVFDQAAMDAVRGWRFEPARYQTQAVKVWARQTVRFKLG